MGRSQSPQGDVRVYEGRRPLTGGALGPRLPLSSNRGGLASVLSPLCRPRSLTWAAESLHPSGYNPHTAGLACCGAAAQYNHVLSIMQDTMDKTLLVIDSCGRFCVGGC